MAKAPAKRTMRDGLENLVTGMGTDRDKLSFTMFAFNALNRAQLDAAYRGDWIARKVIDIPAFDATREWREWQAEKKDITLIEEAENKFFLLQKVKQALVKARLYGGSALVMGIDAGAPEKELKIDQVKKDGLKFVHAVSRYELTAGPIELDITSPYFGEPQYYQRQAIGKPMFKIHPSRVVRFLGAEVADIQTAGFDGWGDSILQVVSDAIRACGTVNNGIANMIDEAKLDVIKIPGLTDNITDLEYEGKLKARFGLAATAKSIYKMLLLDKEEEWQRITQAFTGLDDVMHMYLMIASGAADIPATRMLGQSPKGMNATGENDTRNYYDKVKTEQKTVMGPQLSRLDEVFIRSVFGTRPEELHYDWRSLWQLDEKDSADVALKKAQAFKIDVDSGVIDPQVMRDARQNQLIEDGTYPGLEATIEEFQNSMEDLSPEAQAEKAAQEQANALAVAGAKGAGKPGEPPPAGGKAPPPGKTPPPKGKMPVGDMASRIRVALSDAQPRTLYVYRPVTNWKEIARWAKANGIATTVGKEMHVTIAYSTVAVDWMKAGEDWGGNDNSGNLVIKPGGVRLVEKLGDAICLLFVSSALSWRWCQIKDGTGANWKWPEYQPHITLTYHADSALDLYAMQAFTGEIVLGPEVFETVNEGYKEELVEDAKVGMVFGVRPQKAVAAPVAMTANDVEKVVRTVIGDSARATDRTPNIVVPVTVNMPKPGKKVTKVTKRTATGGIAEIENSED
jgi:phage-related protein (TIGR01555 family)